MGNSSAVFGVLGAALFTFLLASCNADDDGLANKAALPAMQASAGHAPDASLAAGVASKQPRATPAMSRPASKLEFDFEAFAASSLCHN